jgi:hypothetical protein
MIINLSLQRLLIVSSTHLTVCRAISVLQNTVSMLAQNEGHEYSQEVVSQQENVSAKSVTYRMASRY